MTIRGAVREWGKALCVVFAASLAANAQGQSGPAPTFLKVTGALIGKTKKNGSKEPSQDISGMACAPPAGGTRKCLIVDDESQGAQIVILKGTDLVAGDEARLITDTLDGKPIELDAEAVAYADHVFYVVGSHGRSRHPNGDEAAEDEAKAKADKHIFRIPEADIPANGKFAKPWTPPSSGDLKPFLMAEYQAPLSAAYDQELRPNGMTIEGLAVRDKQVFVGFRGPIFSGKAQILVVPAAGVFDGVPAKAELVSLDLGKDRGINYPGGLSEPANRGIRDLVAWGDEFLILAGPVNDPDPARQAKPDVSIPPRCGDYALYRWRGAGTAPVKLRDLDAYAMKIKHDPDKPPKPEGITPLDGANATAILVFDGAAKGSPVLLNLADGFTCPTGAR